MAGTVNPMERIVILDFYRFVAAYGVAFLHISEFAHDEQFKHLVRDLAYFVDFFFVLSGFVIGRNYFGKVQTTTSILWFLQKRIARIYPLYLATLLLFLSIFLFGFSSHGASRAHGLFSTFLQLLMIQQWQLNPGLPLNFPAWSISAEWAMYVAFPLLAFFGRKFGPFSLAILATLGLLLLDYLLKTGQMHVPIWSALRALPTFAIGVLISQIRFSVKGGEIAGAATFGLAIALMLWHTEPLIIIGCFCFCVTLSALEKAPSRSYILGFCGDLSYSVYMLHAVFYSIAFRLLKFQIDSVWLGVVVSMAVIVSAIPTFYFFEKPLRRYLSGISGSAH